MTLKNAVIEGIEMGMTTFTVQHCDYAGRCYEQTADEILNFIEGYENETVVSCYYGTFYSHSIPTKTYSRPNHCHLVYRLKDEKLPQRG